MICGVSTAGELGASGDRTGSWPTTGCATGLDLDAASTLDAGAMTTTPAIRIAGRTKSFGPLELLRGVRFDVTPGSIFALLGPHGAGQQPTTQLRSTLLLTAGGTAAVHSAAPP